MSATPGSTIRQSPVTRLGKWAFILSAAWGLLNIVSTSLLTRLNSDPTWTETVLPVYTLLMVATGLAAGICGLVAIIRNHERSWLVWLSLVVGLLAILRIISWLIILV